MICYAALFFFLCALLFPDRMDEYSGFAEYFHSRQKWCYGLLGALFLADLLDTAIKAAEHFSAFGVGYPVRQGALAALAFVAMVVTDRRYHAAFAAVAIAAEIYWICEPVRRAGMIIPRPRLIHRCASVRSLVKGIS